MSRVPKRWLAIVAAMVSLVLPSSAFPIDDFLLANNGRIVLDATTKSIEATTNAAGTVHYIVSYIDTKGSITTYGTSNGTISSATTVVILAAPAADTKRWVESINLVNSHGATTVTVTLKVDVSGAEYPFRSNIVLAPGADFQMPVDEVAAAPPAGGLNNVVEDLSPELGGDLNGLGNDIYGVASYNEVIYPVGTSTAINAAIASCGVGSGTENHGCTIVLPDGKFYITAKVRVGGLTLGSMQNGIRLVGRGSGFMNSVGQALAGTTLVWDGADGGTMLEVSGFGHNVTGILFEGQSCVDRFNTGGPPQTSGSPDGLCDSNGSTAQKQAAYGIVQNGDNSASAPSGKNIYNDIHVTGILDTGVATGGYGFAFGTSDLGQNDHTILDQVRVSNSRHCLRQSDTQAVENDVRVFDCGSFTESPGILIERGGIAFRGMFIGPADSLSGGVGIQVDSCASIFSWDEGSVEWAGNNGTIIRFSDTGLGCGAGNRYVHRINHVRFQMQQTASTEHTCVEHNVRTPISLTDNTWTSNNADALRKCDLEFNNTSATEPVQVRMSGNRSAFNNGADTTDVAMTVASAGGEMKIVRDDLGRREIRDPSGSAAISKDATGQYADNNNDGDFDVATDLRLNDADLIDIADGTITSVVGVLSAANSNTVSLATTSFVQQEIDDVDNLSDNCILLNTSLPIPDSCVGNGVDNTGGGNAVAVTVDFSAGGAFDATTVVTGQAWVTTTSRISCAPTMTVTADKAEGAEDVLLEDLTVAAHSRVNATGFTVKAYAPNGAHGAFTFHCVGA